MSVLRTSLSGLGSLGLVGRRGLVDIDPEVLGGSATGARLARMKTSPQFDGSTFHNRRELPMMGDGWTGAMVEWFKGGKDREPAAPLPVVRPDLALAPSDGLRVTWLGHSTLLIEIGGARVLTDPVWGQRASPFGGMGPARFHPPPLPLTALPPIDVVLLSHDHYDHLDHETIVTLAGSGVEFVAPLGVGAHLEAWGVAPERITERDWWEGGTIANGRVTLTAVPAQHFSGRGMGDRNATLWASWVVSSERHKVFFSGDTGEHAEFAAIGARFGPFDLCAIEIGAFHPSWASVHIGPAGAVRAHQALGGDLLLPIHWGTFSLGLHAWRDPGEQVVEAAQRARVNLALPPLGGSVEPRSVPVAPWWRACP